MTYLNCKLRLLALFVAAPSCSCFSFLSLRHTNCVLLFHFTLYSEFTSTDHDPLYKPAVKWAETLGSSLNTTVEIKVIFILLAGSGIYSSDILQLHSKRSNVGLFTQSLVAPQSWTLCFHYVSLVYSLYVHTLLVWFEVKNCMLDHTVCEGAGKFLGVRNILFAFPQTCPKTFQATLCVSISSHSNHFWVTSQGLHLILSTLGAIFICILR